jgi:peptidyl-tRNA hydrolase, PTH1 family
MTHFIIGLGNPKEEYTHTRHNAGATLLEAFRRQQGMPEWANDKKLRALTTKGMVGREKVTLILPQGYMNKSGLSVKPLVTSAKMAERLIVTYDDLDLPIGGLKISFGRSSGGHRGVESIIRNIKTKDFVRLRLGITPVTPAGKLKKPKGEGKILDFLMGAFTKKEHEVLKEAQTRAAKALTSIITEGKESAMAAFN